MAWTITDPIVGAQPIAETSTTQCTALALGQVVNASDPTYGAGKFIYLLGAASTAIGTWSTIRSDDNSTVRLVADAAGPVGVAMSANVASQYGWYQIYGKASALAAASFADNGDVYITATAGVVDDAVVDGDMVHLAKGASTITDAGLADFEIAYPYTDNITTND